MPIQWTDRATWIRADLRELGRDALGDEVSLELIMVPDLPRTGPGAVARHVVAQCANGHVDISDEDLVNPEQVDVLREMLADTFGWTACTERHRWR